MTWTPLATIGMGIFIFFICILLFGFWSLLRWLQKPRIIIVNPNNVLSFYTMFPSKGKKGKTFLINGIDYPAAAEFAMPQTGWMFWKKTYCFDRGSVFPRKLEYKGTKWAGADAITKIMNDESVKLVLSELFPAADHLMLMLGMLFSFVAMMAALYVATQLPGLLKLAKVAASCATQGAVQP
jgi:hypothetical protein